MTLYNHGQTAASATVEDLERYTVPTLEELQEVRGEGAGARWAPMHHRHLRDCILTEARAAGLTIAVDDDGKPMEHYSFGNARKSERCPDGIDQHQLFGCITFDLQVPSLPDTIGSVRQVLGFRHDNLQRFKLLGVTGANVFVCSNMAIVGDFIFGHKHGSMTELPSVIHTGFGDWQEQQERAHRLIGRMAETPIDDRDAAHLLLEATVNVLDPEEPMRQHGNRQVRNIKRPSCLSSSQCHAIYSLWRDKGRNGGAFEARTAWSLYNALNERAKGWRPRVVEKSLRTFGEVCADVLGFDTEDRPQLTVPLLDSGEGFKPDHN